MCFQCRLPTWTNTVLTWRMSPVINQSSFAVLIQPRVYPKRFGERVCLLMPQLLTKGQGQPRLQDLPQDPAHELLAKAPYSDWPEANLKEVVRYLKGNKALSLPKEWKDAFPRVLWIWMILGVYSSLVCLKDTHHLFYKAIISYMGKGNPSYICITGVYIYM